MDRRTGFEQKEKQKKGVNDQRMAANMKLAASGIQAARGGQQAGQSGGGFTEGAMTGLSAGLATGNPYAAAGMAVVGGVMGAMADKQKRKERRAQMEAEAEMGKQAAISAAEGDKGQRINNALARLGQAFSNNLTRQRNIRL